MPQTPDTCQARIQTRLIASESLRFLEDANSSSSALAHGGRTEPLVAVFSHHREGEAGTSSHPCGRLTETGAERCPIGIAFNPTEYYEAAARVFGNPIEKYCKLTDCGERFGLTASIAGGICGRDHYGRRTVAGRVEVGITGRVTQQPGAPGGDTA